MFPSVYVTNVIYHVLVKVIVYPGGDMSHVIGTNTSFFLGTRYSRRFETTSSHQLHDHFDNRPTALIDWHSSPRRRRNSDGLHKHDRVFQDTRNLYRWVMFSQCIQAGAFYIITLKTIVIIINVLKENDFSVFSLI